MRPLLLVLVLSVACSDEPDIPKPAHRGVDAPDQEAWDVTKKVTRNGRLRASIRAPHLRKYDRERISRLDGGVSVTFYGQRSGEVLSRLTSKKAEIDEFGFFCSSNLVANYFIRERVAKFARSSSSPSPPSNVTPIPGS